MRGRALILAAVSIGWSLAATDTATARNLRRTLGAPTASQGGVVAAALAPLGAVVGAQVANQIPTLSTSAGFTYEYNPALEAFERSAATFGPLFTERAVTVGARRLNMHVAYSYIRFTEIDGRDLDHLTSRVEAADLDGAAAFAGVRRPELASQFPGLQPSQVFTQLEADLDLEAQIVDLGVTYGLLADLDVNVAVPLVYTFARSRVTERTLDPRFAALAGIAGSAEIEESFAARESAFGIGDVRVRAKYVAVTRPVRLAGMLDLALPTGSPGNLHGTGTTRLGAYAIVSQTIAGIVEPHAQAGVEFNTDDVDKSQAKYAVGVTGQIGTVAALSVDFLGRSEFAALATVPNSARLPAVENGQFVESSPPFHGRPFLLDIERNDVLDLALGAKLSIAARAIVFASVIVPLNHDGLRADVTPTVGVEATF